jgi:hypothetical protein
MIPIKKAVLAGGLVAATLTGGAIGASVFGTAGAAESTTTTVADSQDAPSPSTDGQAPPAPRGPHEANGITETPLTGDDYDKAVAAAKEAVPDGTVQRVETDADGDAYEVHMTKADGSCVTVKLDENFKVVTTEEGPMGGGRHGGPRPDGAPQPSSTSTSDTQA